TACISTSLVLLLLGAVVLVVLSAGRLSDHVRENLELSLLLNDNAETKDVERIIRYVEAQRYTKEVRYISKEDILAEQTASMGLDPTEFLGYNPYTASVEVKLKAEYANTDSIVPIKNRLMRYTQIREISYPSELMDNVNENIRKISALLLVLALALSLISFALINNTIKLTIYSQRFLLHTMKLVGASWRFIRRPFLMRNLGIGLASGILANGVLGGGIYLLLRYEPQLSHLFTVPTLAIVGGCVMLFGMVITLFCANVSINRFLRMKAGDLYYI
ncbi:MAG: permease-like cell division protein FtsX, partial [Bacteroidaceae bacterium]|nr:permease-like cell division protein FtsX [Bacteroidaceae bacterium]